MSEIRIVVTAGSLENVALALARQTGLVFSNDNKQATDIALQISEHSGPPGYRLELIQTGKNAPGAVSAEFVSGTARHRRLYGGGRNQALARAMGLKRGVNPDVLDATAGLGRDAFVLACIGCNVVLLERSPVIHALLENGIQRAYSDLSTEKVMNARVRLIHADSIQYLHGLKPGQCPDVLYMDPMYPDRSKSALVKKEMRLFKRVIGDDIDAAELLSVALQTPIKRIVVKRPRQAPNIGEHEPFTMIETKNTRYDVYIQHH